jgi:hypothetical protein
MIAKSSPPPPVPPSRLAPQRLGSAAKMISRQLVLTYLYLLIYVCLSSGVILFNNVGSFSSSQCGVYRCLCVCREANQGSLRSGWRRNRGKWHCTASVKFCPFCSQIQLVCEVYILFPNPVSLRSVYFPVLIPWSKL